jgi:hypothetical protein
MKTRPVTKSSNLSLRVRPEIRDGLEREAARDRRPMAQLIEIVLGDYLAQRAAVVSAGHDAR